MTITVLCIEDEPELREDLVSELRDMGFAVVEAEDGMAGLAELARQHIDVILCDMQLPRLSGLDLLRQLHGSAGAPPVIMLTAFSDPALHDEIMALGAAAVLIKPADFDDIIALLTKVAAAAG